MYGLRKTMVETMVKTYVHEESISRIQVYHQRKVVFERELSFFCPIHLLRKAREDADRLCAWLKENPDAETAPLEEGWTWRLLK